MATLYKLTDANNQTYNNTQWGPGVEHTAPGNGPLCSPAWIHAYTDPLLAILLNPIHAHIAAPRLWLADGDVGADDYGLKIGCTRLRTLREIELPIISLTQRVAFSILCAREVCENADWGVWTEAWLSGADRSQQSAQVAAEAVTERAVDAAARAAAAAWEAAAATAWAAPARPDAATWSATAAWEAAVVKTLDLAGIARRAVDEWE